MIGGLPARGVRLALRRLPPRPFDADTLAACMRPEGSTAHGRALLSALVADGLAEPEGDGWALTRAGTALAAASARKPITRAKAEALLAAFLGRVRAARDDETWTHRPQEIYLFGSLLTTDKTFVGDVDLVAVLRGRFATEAEQEDADRAYRRRRRAAAAGGLGWIEEMYAPTEDLRRFLRGRSPGIALATEQTLADLTGERFDLLYEHPSFTPAGEAWLARGDAADTGGAGPPKARVAAVRPFDPPVPRRRGQ